MQRVKKILKIGGITFASLFFLMIVIGLTVEPKPKPTDSEEEQVVATANATTTTSSTPEKVDTTTQNPASSATSTPTKPASQPASPTSSPSQPATTQPAPSNLVSVTSVVDGDTIKVSLSGKTETIRLIGMDTPETVDPRKPVQCFGTQASNKAKELLVGRKVQLEMDASQGERDKYGRLLAYIRRDDGLFFNKYMIEQGYAHEYTYNTPYKYQAEFKLAQKTAQENQRGLWSPTTCNGDTTTAASGSTTPAPTSTGSTSQTSGKFYTSSHSSSKYYYPEACDGWKSLSPSYLKSFGTLEALLAAYPSRTKSPQCN